MTTVGHAYCASCGEAREPVDLLRVTDRLGQVAPYLICRPATRGGLCFTRSVGPADRWSIELATAPTGEAVRVGPDEHEQSELARILDQSRRREARSITW